MYIQMTELFLESMDFIFLICTLQTMSKICCELQGKNLQFIFYEKIIPFSIVVVCPSFRGLR